ncbi:MAG: GNAT family N-acetyltransferase [Caldiserica bacterium]|nr:GNAT family N-acetyltransferase [Caldisericota bacterium]
MEARLIEDVAAFAQLEPFWNPIVVRSSSNTCHSTFEWLFTWWRHFSAGRHLLLLVAYEHGMPAGLAPLYVGTGERESRDLHFLGQGLSDYADFIVPRGRPDIMEVLVASVLAYRQLWNGIDLEEIPSESPGRGFLERLCTVDGTPAAWHSTVRCPYLPIEGSWDAFYSSMGKGFRHEVRNKVNRWNKLNSHPGDGQGLCCSDRGEVDGAFVNEVVALSDKRRTADGHRSPFLNHPDQEFLREVLPLMGARSQLRVGEVRTAGVLLAFVLSFYWQGVVYTWNTQYDPAYRAYSLGRMALVKLAEKSFSEGCRELNFMRGEEPYKFEWTRLSRTNLAFRTEPMVEPAGDQRTPRDRGMLEAEPAKRST